MFFFRVGKFYGKFFVCCLSFLFVPLVVFRGYLNLCGGFLLYLVNGLFFHLDFRF